MSGSGGERKDLFLVEVRVAEKGQSIGSPGKGGGSVADMGRSLTIAENATMREGIRRTYLQDWRARIDGLAVRRAQLSRLGDVTIGGRHE
jgi:hypothetical protein